MAEPPTDSGKPFDPMDDPMAPPKESCECWCLHCERTFNSSEMWFQRVIGDRGGFPGFWMCPTSNCGGAGFGFDIFPTDPDHPANAGWHSDDEDEGFDPDGDNPDASDTWDPDETKYKRLDEEAGDCGDDDIEGEEWKFGLQPGDARPPVDWQEQARREWEEGQKRYDMPDERPRTLDWSNREDREPIRDFDDDDIPF